MNLAIIGGVALLLVSRKNAVVGSGGAPGAAMSTNPYATNLGASTGGVQRPTASQLLQQQQQRQAQQLAALQALQALQAQKAAQQQQAKSGGGSSGAGMGNPGNTAPGQPSSKPPAGLGSFPGGLPNINPQSNPSQQVQTVDVSGNTQTSPDSGLTSTIAPVTDPSLDSGLLNLENSVGGYNGSAGVGGVTDATYNDTTGQFSDTYGTGTIASEAPPDSSGFVAAGGNSDFTINVDPFAGSNGGDNSAAATDTAPIDTVSSDTSSLGTIDNSSSYAPVDTSSYVDPSSYGGGGGTPGDYGGGGDFGSIDAENLD